MDDMGLQRIRGAIHCRKVTFGSTGEVRAEHLRDSAPTDWF